MSVIDWVKGPRAVKGNFRHRPFNGPKNDKTRARMNYPLICLMGFSLANHNCIQNEPEQPDMYFSYTSDFFIKETSQQKRLCTFMKVQ